MVNGTSYAWMQDYIHSYWMPPWNFPTAMGAGIETSAWTSVYVDFGEGSLRERSVNDDRKCSSACLTHSLPETNPHGCKTAWTSLEVVHSSKFAFPGRMTLGCPSRMVGPLALTLETLSLRD